jgi:hypothetical protein
MCLGFLAGGVAAIRAGFGEWQLNRESASWPEVAGTVAKAWVKHRAVKTGNDPSQQDRSDMYEVFVDYTFTAEGKTLSKTSTSPQQTPDGENTQEAADDVAASFQPGEKIAVYYQPGNPDESRLKRVEVSSTAWLVLGVGGGSPAVLLSLVGIWYMLFRFQG